MTEQTNNRQAQLSAYVAIATTGAAALAVMAVSNAITGAIDSLPPATTAGIVTSLPVMAVSICGFASFGTIGAAAFIVAWRTPRAAQRQYRDDDEPRIIASPRSAQIQQPQYRQLPQAPLGLDEPAFSAYRGDIAVMAERETATFTNEFAVPVPDTQAPQLGRVTARLGEGDEVTIARAAWLAFAALDTPTRDAWREQLRGMNAAAPNEDYSRCKKIASSYKLLDGAGAFISHKLRDMVTSWVCGTGEQ